MTDQPDSELVRLAQVVTQADEATQEAGSYLSVPLDQRKEVALEVGLERNAELTKLRATARTAREQFDERRKEIEGF
jgi:hypothetical protein